MNYQAEIKYKILDKEFDSRTFHFKQLKREHDIAIYEKTKEGFNKGSKILNYEVIKVLRHEGLKYPGKEALSAPAEFYPSAERWGSHGFSYKSLAEAEKRFSMMLVEKPKTSKNINEQPTQEEIMQALEEQQQSQSLAQNLASDTNADTMKKTNNTKTGRKRLELNIVIPEGKFTTVQFLSVNTGAEPTLRTRLNELVAGGSVEIAGKLENKNTKGRKSFVYQTKA